MKKLVLLLFFVMLLFLAESCTHSYSFYRMEDPVVAEQYRKITHDFVYSLLKNPKNYIEIMYHNDNVDCDSLLLWMSKETSNVEALKLQWPMNQMARTRKGVLDMVFNIIDTNSIDDLGCKGYKSRNYYSDYYDKLSYSITYKVAYNNSLLDFNFLVLDDNSKKRIMLYSCMTYIASYKQLKSLNLMKYNTVLINEKMKKAERLVSQIMDDPQNYLKILENEKDIDCSRCIKEIIEKQWKKDLDDGFRRVKNYKLTYEFFFRKTWFENHIESSLGNINGFHCYPSPKTFSFEYYNLPDFNFEFYNAGDSSIMLKLSSIWFKDTKAGLF